MFCQDDARARGGVAEGGITDYDAMRRCFVCVRSMAQVQGKRVYTPHNIGCRITGVIGLRSNLSWRTLLRHAGGGVHFDVERGETMTEYIERDTALETFGVKKPRVDWQCVTILLPAIRRTLVEIPAVNVIPVPATGIGDLSDGYHTFNQLYHQRIILFAALVRLNRDHAWKSRRHEDGALCFGGGWFIVGIDTPESGHYEDKYFELFDCAELTTGKAWDGHTEKDVTRLLSLPLYEKEASV